MFLMLLPFALQVQAETLESSADFSCNWDFNYNFNCGTHYNAGHNLYVKANPNRHQDIDWMELYVNNQFVRKESSYPYEWAKSNSNGDNYLKNMQAGTYTIKIKVKDKCGQYHEKTCVVYIDGHSGGNHNTQCNWQYNYNIQNNKHYNAGHNLYVKAEVQRHQDVDWVELYCNNQLIRKETNYPYEWAKPNSNGDNYLKNMQPGTYKFKLKMKDKCGQYHEKLCTIYIDHANGGNTGNTGNCDWNFNYNFNCGTHYNAGHNLYVKANPTKHQDIDWMELYVNNQMVRKETGYPFEWAKSNSSGDNQLRNMQPGTYTIKIKVKDKCGKYHEKTCVVYIDAHNGGNTGNTQNCDWNFNYNFNCGTHYNAGHNLYVKANPTKHQDIDWMELYVNNQLVRKESSYPFEWAKSNSNGDSRLRNMQPGTYTIKIKVKDKCGKYHEKTCVVYIDAHNGGNHNTQCNWNSSYQYPNNTHYPNHTNLYVKVQPNKHQDIDWMELYVNNQLVRKESSYPYEWAKQGSNGDSYLRNMRPGKYTLKCKIKDKCGQYHEKVKTITIRN